MATDFTQDALLHFLQSRGGSAKNSDMLLHFRDFLRVPEDRTRHRELFKKFVNSVATVRQVDGVSYVFLRRKFRGYVPGAPGARSLETSPRPLETSARSLETSPRPLETSARPLETTARPLETTARPLETSARPLETSPRSLETTARPLETTARPLETSARPLETSPQIPAGKPLQKQQVREVTPPATPGATAREIILPAAGIINNNNNNKVATNWNQVIGPPGPPGRPAHVVSQVSVKTPRPPEPPEPHPGVGQPWVGPGRPPQVTPVGQQVPGPEAPRGREACLQPEGGLHQGPPLHHVGLDAPRRMRYRPSYKSAVSYDDDDEEEEEEEVQVRRGSAGGAWPPSVPLGDLGRAVSSPCIVDPHVPPSVVSPSSSSSSSERTIPKIFVQVAETMPPGGPGRSSQLAAWQGGRGAGPGLVPGSVPAESTRRSLPLEAERYAPSAAHRDDVHADRRYSHSTGVQPNPGQGAWLSSSHSTSRGPGWNSSDEDPQARAGPLTLKGVTEGGSQIQEAIQRAQRKKVESVTHHANGKTPAPWHHSTDSLHDDQEAMARLPPSHHSSGRLHDDQYSAARGMPWHLSTGDLHDEEAESSEGSTSSLLRPRPPAARRLSSRLCQSLGANLDQLLQEEARAGGGSEAARLNRLHLISSSLSLRYDLSSSSLSSCSTPPRCHSLADLDEGAGERAGRRRSSAAVASSPASPAAQHEGSSRQSLVPLEPREHAWLVKGASGAWPDIYTLFREDSSLLNKQDFMSGFTVLHWIAKHGDHRVLNTLWYGVQKAGLTFHTNAKSTCGHTPLHIAAIHAHNNIIRLLVNKFNADVKLRDTAGKKPWQYLNRAAPPDIFQLLGAPSRLAGRGQGGGGRGAPGLEQGQSPCQQQQQQRRRRRHHLSFASSGERPPTMTGTTRVKRSTSIAAFLKHKSMLRFHGHQSDSSV